MLPYIIGTVCYILMYRVEVTGKLKLLWGVLALLVVYIIIFYIEELS